jgi:hypothetical protein
MDSDLSASIPCARIHVSLRNHPQFRGSLKALLALFFFLVIHGIRHPMRVQRGECRSQKTGGLLVRAYEYSYSSCSPVQGHANLASADLNYDTVTGVADVGPEVSLFYNEQYDTTL